MRPEAGVTPARVRDPAAQLSCRRGVFSIQLSVFQQEEGPRAIAVILILKIAKVKDEFLDEPQEQVWTFTGLFGVDLDEKAEVELGGGFLLSKPTDFLLSARSKFDLSCREFDHIGAADCFFAHRDSQSVLRGRERDRKIEDFQTGLIALQILKPVQTSGFIF